MNLSKFKKVIYSILVFSTFLLLVPNQVFAGLGISPAEIQNMHIKPGMSYEQVFEISRSKTDYVMDVSVSIDMNNEEQNEWISIEPSMKFQLDEGVDRRDMTVKVDVPEDAELGEYNGFVRIETTGDSDGPGAVTVTEGARIDVNLTVTDQDYTELLVRLMKFEDVYGDDPIKLMLKIENKGNVEAAPSKVIAKIKDLTQTEVATIETQDIEKVEPGKTQEVYAYFENTLEKGEYFGDVSVYNGDELLIEDTLLLRVFSEGERETGESEKTTDEEKTFLGLGLDDRQLMMVGGGIIALGLIVVLVLLGRKRTKEEHENLNTEKNENSESSKKDLKKKDKPKENKKAEKTAPKSNSREIGESPLAKKRREQNNENISNNEPTE